jgi:putative transposase
VPRHSVIALHTPAPVHYGTHHEVGAQRQGPRSPRIVNAAFSANPLRFRRRAPIAPQIPDIAWINQPVREELAQIC